MLQVLGIDPNRAADVRHVAPLLDPQQPAHIAQPITAGIAGLRTQISTVAGPEALEACAQILHRFQWQAPEFGKSTNLVFIS